MSERSAREGEAMELFIRKTRVGTRIARKIKHYFSQGIDGCDQVGEKSREKERMQEKKST